MGKYVKLEQDDGYLLLSIVGRTTVMSSLSDFCCSLVLGLGFVVVLSFFRLSAISPITTPIPMPIANSIYLLYHSLSKYAITVTVIS